MFDIHFTLAYVVAGLRSIVDEFGEDHMAGTGTTASCIYAKIVNGALVPVCIVGQFFAREGLLRALVQELHLNFENTVEPAQFEACLPAGPMWVALERFGITADEDAQEFLRQAQLLQDSGNTWGQALNGALDNMRVIHEGRVRKAVEAAEREVNASDLGRLVASL